MENKNSNPKKCMSPIFRASFPHVFEPHVFKGSKPKFSLVMLFNKKEADIKPLRDAVIAAATEKWGPKEKWPKGLKFPFKDGDEKSDLQGYEGCTTVSASSLQKPGLVGSALDPETGELEKITKESGRFYPGCYARATLLAYSYETAGNKGVSFALQNIQKVGDGDSFNGRKDAADEFAPVAADTSNDPNNYNSDEYDLGF